MKNKTKKILAGACLGLVGMGCLTGCSMNDEQITNINSKVDTAIEIFEEQNKELNNLVKELQEQNSTLKLENDILNSQFNKDDAWNILYGAIVNLENIQLQQTNYKLNIDIIYYEDNIITKENQSSIVLFEEDGYKYCGWLIENNNEDLYNVIKISYEDMGNAYYYGNGDQNIFKVNPLTIFNSTTNTGLKNYHKNNLVSWKYENNEFIFNLYISSTDIDDENVEHNASKMIIKVKDSKVISMNIIDYCIESNVNDLTKDDNGEYIEDGFGGYEIYSNNITSASDYTYSVFYDEQITQEDVEKVNKTIAAIDLKIESGELSFN